MLQEYKDVSQHKGCYRRYFYDDFFDLFVWYEDRESESIGFQLCYNKKFNEHSITWDKQKGYLHSGIDDGENLPGGAKSSPVLVADGKFDNILIAEKFRENSQILDSEITDLVHLKLLEYNKRKENPFL